MRRLLALILLVAVAPGTLLRDAPKVYSDQQVLAARSLPLPPQAVRAALLGPFDLDTAWQLDSPHSSFGGYSALVMTGPAHFLAISDSARTLAFIDPALGPQPLRMGGVTDLAAPKFALDTEAATRDPATGTIWIAWEGLNAVSRHSADDTTMQAMVQPPAMRGWPSNKGPEAMVRLHDGRFIVLSESFNGWFGGTDHQALLFAGDPTIGAAVQAFTFVGADGYRPTDMAELPDGRVLILMRRVLWPMPMKLSGRIMLADPAQITSGGTWQAHELARLDAPLPVDNFEGMAIDSVPDKAGKATVWLISDANSAQFQRTLLWKLTLDPARLPLR
jgi:hypothetical protein